MQEGHNVSKTKELKQGQLVGWGDLGVVERDVVRLPPFPAARRAIVVNRMSNEDERQVGREGDKRKRERRSCSDQQPSRM